MQPLHALLRTAHDTLGKNKLNILIYHQVLPAPDPMRPGETDATIFHWHMQLLRQHFLPLPLGTAVQRLHENTLPARSVCVTFDDGYLNNLTIAEPILRKFRIPATVFVASGFCQGQNMWNDRLIDLLGDKGLDKINLDPLEVPPAALPDLQSRLQQVQQLIPLLKYQNYSERSAIIDALYRANKRGENDRKMLSHAEVIRLSRRGVCIGAHTVDHPILKSLHPTEQRRQIESSKHALENLIGAPVRGFAYPNGRPGKDYDDLSVQLVREAGFDHAVSTAWGVSSGTTSPFELKRYTPWDTTAARFHLRMLRGAMGS